MKIETTVTLCSKDIAQNVNYDDAMQLVKDIDAEQQDGVFTFELCKYLLKDVLQWAESSEDVWLTELQEMISTHFNKKVG